MCSTSRSHGERFGELGEQRQTGHYSKIGVRFQLRIFGRSCPARYAVLITVVMRRKAEGAVLVRKNRPATALDAGERHEHERDETDNQDEPTQKRIE